MAQHNNMQGDLSINASGDDSSPSAILDIQSSTKGILIPRVTSAERENIENPANGLIVYDVTLDQICYNDSTVWCCIEKADTLVFRDTLIIYYPDSCETLDEAYDCGGPGAGRVINVDAGSVHLRGSMANPNTTLEVENKGTGSVATFRDQIAGGGGTENLVIAGQDDGDALQVQVLGAANVNRAVYSFTNSNIGQAGLFEITNIASAVDALEGYNRGDRHGVFGHTDVKVPVFGSFSIAGLPASGVMGVSSNTDPRKGTAGASVYSDGVWGKTFRSSSRYKTVTDPRNIVAGVHGTIESAQSTTEEKDYVGVFGIPNGNGIGVLGIGGPQNSVKGHGVVGVSAWSVITPSTNAGVWGVTRESQSWAALNNRFPLEEEAHNKVQVGVLGQSCEYVAVWGESLARIGVVGTTNTRMSHADLMGAKIGTMGLNGGAGYGVAGIAKSTSYLDAGVIASGQADKDKAAALEIHDGAIRVSKDTAMDTPADYIDVIAGGWNTLYTCPADCDGMCLHDHEQGYLSAPIMISNQYVDAVRSVILVTVHTEIPGVSIQLISQADGMFSVALTIHSANLYCQTNPPSSGYRIHYLIVNK
jgi:hypothetical protein